MRRVTNAEVSDRDTFGHRSPDIGGPISVTPSGVVDCFPSKTTTADRRTDVERRVNRSVQGTTALERFEPSRALRSRVGVDESPKRRPVAARVILKMQNPKAHQAVPQRF